MVTVTLFNLSIFTKVEDYIKALPVLEQQKIRACITTMEEGDFQTLRIRQLRRDIKELKFNNHRFVFFIHDHTIYLIGAFMKKTEKTPKREIDTAEKMRKLILQSL